MCKKRLKRQNFHAFDTCFSDILPIFANEKGKGTEYYLQEDMMGQIIAYFMSPRMGDGYKAGGTIKTHPLEPKDIVVRGFIIDSETGELEEIL